MEKLKCACGLSFSQVANKVSSILNRDLFTSIHLNSPESVCEENGRLKEASVQIIQGGLG